VTDVTTYAYALPDCTVPSVYFNPLTGDETSFAKAEPEIAR